jgi:preprotein translocase subunit SecD
MSQQWKSRVYGLLLLIFLSGAALIPTATGFLSPDEQVLPEWYTKLFKNRLILGLDLQGGIHLQYKVDTRDALLSKSANMALRVRDDLRAGEEIKELKGKAVKVTPIVQKGEEDGSADMYEVTKLSVRFTDAKDAEIFNDKVQTFLSSRYPEYKWLSNDSSKNEVQIGMRKISVDNFQRDALAQAIDTIERRINAFGVAESSISQRDNDKIVVELPGLNEKEFGKAKEKLAQTGLLHFKIVEFEAAKSNAFYSKLKTIAPKAGQWPDRFKAYEAEGHKLYISGNRVISTRLEVLQHIGAQALKGDLEHIVGYEKLYVDPSSPTLDSMNNLTSNQEKEIDKNKEFNPKASVIKAYRLHYLQVEGMSGENVEDAQVGYDQMGRPVTNMRFGSNDAKEFADMTEKHTNHLMAILIDDMVYSAPNINERIGGGRVQITLGAGPNVIKEATALAAVLKSGALQAPLRQLYSSQVGPTLGQDSIEAGKISIIVGFIFVILFMAYWYRRRGMVANLALVLNLLFISAGLAIFGATLTLPGIVGIVLTVGMAVDANVLIFERMREEERTKSKREAFVAGYEKAWSAILDANVTTGIAAIVLYQFGTGPIKGFAVTLGLGIISSMYTAIVVTRLVFEYLNQKDATSLQGGVK